MFFGAGSDDSYAPLGIARSTYQAPPEPSTTATAELRPNLRAQKRRGGDTRRAAPVEVFETFRSRHRASPQHDQPEESGEGDQPEHPERRNARRTGADAALV